MPQTDDGTRLIWLVAILIVAPVRITRGGSRREWKRLSPFWMERRNHSLGARRGGQEAQSYQCNGAKNGPLRTPGKCSFFLLFDGVDRTAVAGRGFCRFATNVIPVQSQLCPRACIDLKYLIVLYSALNRCATLPPLSCESFGNGTNTFQPDSSVHPFRRF